MATANLIIGDCIEEMKKLIANSVDAIITDPPYGLEFMGKDWDKFGADITSTAEDKDNFAMQRKGSLPFGGAGRRVCFNNGLSSMLSFQQFSFQWATECFRVLKAGGFLFAMGGTRTHHRLTCGIEDAGFMIRDELCWVYMQGFPKAQDLAMLIEKKLGGEGKIIGQDGRTAENSIFGIGVGNWTISHPTLPPAQKWAGWKTPALKPAFEPIIVAQKPCEGSITENVMKHGVGGYNIDACRIPFRNLNDLKEVQKQDESFLESNSPTGNNITHGKMDRRYIHSTNEKGRYPSNLLTQEECFGEISRFFLIPKACKNEREENLDGFENKKKWLKGGGGTGITERENIMSKNVHPTVKPIELMQRLIMLVTKPNYTILDPFLGSGTTAIAALNLNRNIIGIEINEEYMKIAKARIAKEVEQRRLSD